MKAKNNNMREKLQRRFARNRKKRAAIENIALASFSILFILPMFFYAAK